MTNPKDRRGPCDEGYHVPSLGERGTLVKYWAEYYVDSGNSLTLVGTYPKNYFNNNKDARIKFQSDFMIPMGGYYSYTRSEDMITYRSNNPHFWSSTYAQDISLNTNGVITTSANFSLASAGISIRCFKN